MSQSKNLILTLLLLFSLEAIAQDKNTGSFLKPIPANYEVKHAVEVESLFPMFFYGGYHVGVGYRYRKFRVRFSLINGGTYDTEPAGVNHNSNFKR